MTIDRVKKSNERRSQYVVKNCTTTITDSYMLLAKFSVFTIINVLFEHITSPHLFVDRKTN